MSRTGSALGRIRREIIADPDNAWAAAASYQPIYVADAAARIVVVGHGTRGSLTATVRRFEDHLPGMLPLVHPSPLNFRWLAKNPWYEAEVLPQLRRSVQAALV